MTQSFDALVGRVDTLIGQGQYVAARQVLESCSSAEQLHPAILFQTAVVLQLLRELEPALSKYDALLAKHTAIPEAWCNRGVVLLDLSRAQAALESFDRALALKPGYPDALLNRGNALRALQRFDEAISAYNHALQQSPNWPLALCNRANVRADLGQYEFALKEYDAVVALNPAYAEAYFLRGGVLTQLRRLPEALESLDEAIRLAPDNAGAWCNRGNTLRDLGRAADALVSYDKALSLNARLPEAHANRAALLFDLRRYDEAAAGFQAAINLKPDFVFGVGNLLKSRMHACNWEGFDLLLSQVREGMRAGVAICAPFTGLMIPSTPIEQMACAKAYAAVARKQHESHTAVLPPRTGDRFRVGYFSWDFHNHATAHLITEMIECHDRSKFDVLLFSYGPLTADAAQRRLRSAATEFIDVSTMSDHDVTELAREKQLDLAVDLKGYTAQHRLGMFFRRIAPVQAHYLGYPGTLGGGVVDYLVADPTLIPPTDRQFYAEKIAYLPYSYQVNDRKRPISPRQFSRADCELPHNAFVFCCFNNNYKISPQSADVWSRILRRVPNSVLWLLSDNRVAERNLTKEFVARGVAADRLIFAERMALPDHLARHACADLFIDTFYCGAHTTASDALWAGLPVLTHYGDGFVGRVAASLLVALGLKELVTHSYDEFESVAVQLAQSPQHLANVKSKLETAKLTQPLFDTPRTTRDMEKLYAQMIQRSRDGLPPDHLFC